MAAAEAAMEALIDQACRDVLPRVYPLPADPFYAAVAKLVILRSGLAKLEEARKWSPGPARSRCDTGANREASRFHVLQK